MFAKRVLSPPAPILLALASRCSTRPLVLKMCVATVVSTRVLLEAGWKAVYGEEAEPADRAEEDTGGDQLLPLDLTVLRVGRLFVVEGRPQPFEGLLPHEPGHDPREHAERGEEDLAHARVASLASSCGYRAVALRSHFETALADGT